MFDEYILSLSQPVQRLFAQVRLLIQEATHGATMEVLWAKMPTFMVGEKYVRVIPFADHINIQASTITEYKHLLTGYKITPKGMLQIYTSQRLPTQALNQIICATLGV